MNARREHGMVLLAVLVVITIAALIGSTLLVTVDAERSGAETTLRRTQSRALAWSGAQLVMGEFAAQREQMLVGEDFDIETEWDLFVDELGRTAVVRLVPVGPNGELFVSETAKLDINHATLEMLAALPGIGTEGRAQAIIDARPFSSVEELVRVEGFAADLLYGFSEMPDELIAPLETPADNVIGGGTHPGSADPGADTPALIDLLTVFSFDPNVQAGVQDPDKRGKLRVNLNVPWSDRLARAIEDQWGEEVVQVAENLFNSGMKFESDRQIVENVMGLGVTDPQQLGPILDAITTSDDMYRLGRVDVLRAPPEVLDALPGVDRTMALEMVDLRERLAEADRLSPVWLAGDGLLSPTDFAVLADWVTMRSSQWRIRIEAGYRSADAVAEVAGVADSVLEGLAQELSADDALEDRVIYDIVIDAASQRPRIAYLREVTLLELARALRTEEIGQRAGRAQEEYETDLFEQVGLGDEPGGVDQEGDPLAAAAGDGGEDSEEPEVSRSDEARAARAAAREERRAGMFADEEADEPDEVAEPTMPGEPVDRRIGRWRSGGGA